MPSAVSKLRQIVESEGDPKKVMRNALGPLDNDVVTGCRVLVATYAGTKYVPGSKAILRDDANLQENQYQGSIGLVVKVGPGAFVDAPGAAFHGVKAKEGDWVLTRPADGLQLLLNSVPCRLFEDVNILMVVDNPDKYY